VLYAAKKDADIATMPRPKIDGVITFTVDAATREILGATLFCVDSQEVINLVALAMRAHVTADQLLNESPRRVRGDSTPVLGVQPFFRW
jgi:pyruvate/2-oxoglutarate dehydrogenase complex dihydrolipoamide dehydrogenase (E3) component